jgi:hypothetical protein
MTYFEIIKNAEVLLNEAYQLAGKVIARIPDKEATEEQEIRLLDILAYDLPDAIAAMQKSQITRRCFKGYEKRLEKSLKMFKKEAYRTTYMPGDNELRYALKCAIAEWEKIKND